ncbi:anti-sigma factor [Streptacidiphilus sp. MAP5-3]|uniref:anti-sigma factor family protein n=1 Tax=unclassified Streptacidiphilus TaxID=2643834 RepID=UPI003512C3D3
MSERPRRAARSEAAELRVTPVSVAVPASPAQEHHLGDRLAAFIDGELDHGARERVQAHLATCPTCLAEAEEARQLKSRLREVLPPDPSPVFMTRLLSIAAPGAGDDGEGPSSGQPVAGAARGVRSLFGGSGSGFGSAGGLGGGGLRGSSFGSGALGADHPVPGVDPRARRERSSRALREVREPRDSGGHAGNDGGSEGSRREEPRPIAARLRAGVGGGLMPSQPLSGVLAAAAAPMGTQRGRRLVFAAAGAFSVAAVTLSTALTGVSASSDAPADVSPLSGTGNYAPAGSQLALENLHGNDSAAQEVMHRTTAFHPMSDPSVVPARRLLP